LSFKTNLVSSLGLCCKLPTCVSEWYCGRSLVTVLHNDTRAASAIALWRGRAVKYSNTTQQSSEVKHRSTAQQKTTLMLHTIHSNARHVLWINAVHKRIPHRYWGTVSPKKTRRSTTSNFRHRAGERFVRAELGVSGTLYNGPAHQDERRDCKQRHVVLGIALIVAPTVTIALALITTLARTAWGLDTSTRRKKMPTSYTSIFTSRILKHLPF
jgi:hypothetical protein